VRRRCLHPRIGHFVRQAATISAIVLRITDRFITTSPYDVMRTANLSSIKRTLSNAFFVVALTPWNRFFLG
jgi:hypothetical protein